MGMFTGMLLASMMTVFDPQAPGTQAGMRLAWITMIVCTVIFFIVAGIIVFSLMRYRWREGEADPEQIAGNKTVELIWTGIPFLIVVALFTLTMRTMSSADPDPPANPDLIVTGHQWWWQVEYPKSGVITANEIHIPVGRPVSVLLDSKDVLHEFWVAELTRKMTTVPGHPNHIWLEADKPGIYLGVCSEFCGTEHAWMRFTVVAEEPDQFEAWQKAQLQPPPVSPAGTSAANGAALFHGMSCASCHSIDNGGTPPGDRVEIGPDLTHFATRTQFGGGISENTPQNLALWLKNPQQVKPGVKMPDFNLTDQQVGDLVNYFETLK